jgi:hypothetical protein
VLHFVPDSHQPQKAVQALAQALPGVILSFRVSRGCDLRGPVGDTVADGTLAA